LALKFDAHQNANVPNLIDRGRQREDSGAATESTS
jgi:hypothetical protein